MNQRISEFEQKHLHDAARLLAGQSAAIPGGAALTYEQGEQGIRESLKQEQASGYTLIESGELAGFLIAVIEEDGIWGRTGWVRSGSWAVAPGHEGHLSALYAAAASRWVGGNVLSHCIEVPAGDRELLEELFDLGFGREQVYGYFSLEDPVPEGVGDPRYTVRRAASQDQPQVSGFSRVIAGYQTMSPVFALAPEEYLKALDEGFSRLTVDPDAELFVIEDDAGEIPGIIVFDVHPQHGPQMLEGSVELVICAVKEASRGKGIGRQLVTESLQSYKDVGYHTVVTDWRSANQLSSRFWKSMGFIPYRYRMRRRIDPLISV